MNKTKIEYCDYTLNQITGCLNHINGMCKGGNFPCYAYKLAHGRLKQRYLANNIITRTPYETRRFGKRYLEYAADPFYPRFWPERFTVKGIPKGSKIFLNNMSDWMGIGIPQEWTKKVLDFIRANAGYTFLTLTKQPQNLIKWSPFPENCWVGFTAASEQSWLAGIDRMQYIKAKVKFVSFEPLLEAIDLIRFIYDVPLDWVIIGQCTPVSAKTQPKIEWIREIVQAADKAGIPIFLKDNLRPLLRKDEGLLLPTWATEYSEKEKRFYLRQEFPRC